MLGEGVSLAFGQRLSSGMVFPFAVKQLLGEMSGSSRHTTKGATPEMAIVGAELGLIDCRRGGEAPI